MKKFLYLLFVLGFVLPSCKTTEKSSVERFVVASQQGDCIGVAPMKCLLIKKEGQTDWQFFYDTIEGFNYTSGYEYVIDVKSESLPPDDLPADKSSVKYTLVKEISKTEKQSDNLPKPVN